jgi:ubiquinone/menaquinone biosynthesis C-methylase UbiE
MASKFVARGADKYDAYMGRWSRRLAPLFLDFAGLAAGERVLEVGCGTGSLTFALPARTDIAAVEAIDYEKQFVEAARERNSDPRINIQQGDACNLQFADGKFDRVLSMLVLHFVSDPDDAISEMRRVLRPGGIAAATVWDIFGGMPSFRMFWDIAAAIEPRAAERRDAVTIRAMTQAGELPRAFSRVGFHDVKDTTLTVQMEFANFADYWDPMMMGQGTHAELLASLAQPTRDAIEATVRAAYLCNRPDGPRSFASVAWAVRGVR